MEKEKIITTIEILDYSEDEEPPSGVESKIFTFDFPCVNNDVFRLPTLKFPFLGSTPKQRKLLPAKFFTWHNWLYPNKGIVMSVFQIKMVGKSFNQLKNLNPLYFRLSLYKPLNHYRLVVDDCLLKMLGDFLPKHEIIILQKQNYPRNKGIPSNQFIISKINYQ